MRSILEKAEKTAKLSTSIKSKKEKKEKEREKYKSYRKKKIASGRKCRLCGNDPYPNYFFCPACHHKIGMRQENVG